MNAKNQFQDTESSFYRFQVFQGKMSAEGKVEKTKTVGMAYLKSGQDIYTLRLWTFLDLRYYLLPNQREAGRYLVMSREPTKHPDSKSKYYWNIVGNGRVDSKSMCMEIEFDLFDKRIYMSLFPEHQPTAKNLPEPIDFETIDAAA